MTSIRFWAVMLLLISTGVVLHRRGDVDHVPSSKPLAELPHTIGALTGVDIPIAQETLDVLGKGDFLNRMYAPATAENAMSSPEAVGFFIAYFPTQRSGQSIHSPQNCLPGSGWSFASSGTTSIPGADGAPIEVGEYLITNGSARDEVLYWYQTHGRAIANDYKAKLYMLTDSIRYNRTDAALVRIVVSLNHGESQSAGHDRAVAFARQMMPLLPAYIPN